MAESLGLRVWGRRVLGGESWVESLGSLRVENLVVDSLGGESGAESLGEETRGVGGWNLGVESLGVDKSRG